MESIHGDGRLREAAKSTHLKGMWSLTVIALDDDPGRRVADAQVDDFASEDHGVQTPHQFFDPGREIPPMDVQLYQLSVALRHVQPT